MTGHDTGLITLALTKPTTSNANGAGSTWASRIAPCSDISATRSEHYFWTCWCATASSSPPASPWLATTAWYDEALQRPTPRISPPAGSRINSPPLDDAPLGCILPRPGLIISHRRHPVRWPPSSAWSASLCRPHGTIAAAFDPYTRR